MKRHTNQKEKRQQIKLHLKTNWEASNRSISRALGVHHNTVKSVRDELVQSGGISQLYTDKKSEPWREHPYIKANPHLLETLNPRGLRALKRIPVLDYMLENSQIKSPCVAQAKLAKQAIIRRKTAPHEVTEDDVDIRVADVTKLDQLDFMPNEVDLCICDPPYGKTSAEVCRGIADAASVKLRDGGSLLMLTGSSHLPEVMAALSSNKTLKYHWLLVCPLPQGAAASTSWLRVQSKVRIVLWFVKGGKYTGDIVSDFIQRPTLGNPASKTHHEWGAPEELISELIVRYSDPGQIVADFTVGGGAVAVEAIRLGRKFYGSDVSEDAVSITRKRVRQLFGYTR